MPGTEQYPFRRLAVDHMIRGVSRIWWEMHRRFRDPQPHVFQLQWGTTGNPNATDWKDVGSPVVNGFFAEDDERHPSDYGKSLTTHYRVKLTTPEHVYVSNPVHTFGELGEKDWLFAREICRKEILRHKLVSRGGFLLRRMRFGEPCEECTDELTGEILDSKCPECNGTGFKVGYHAPTPLDVDMNPEAIIELLRATEPPGPARPTDQQIRIKGFPAIAKHDIWVDEKSDQRWIFHDVYHLAEWRGVPLVTQVKVKLLPFTDQAYKIEVGGEEADLPGPILPTTGEGDTCIDHDYGGVDNLAYRDSNGDGIEGATILVFTKADYDNGLTTADRAVASSSTMANGRWSFSICICCDTDYVLVFEKAGQFGPDACEINVPCSESSQSSEQAQELTAEPSTFWGGDAGMGIQ